MAVYNGIQESNITFIQLKCIFIEFRGPNCTNSGSRCIYFHLHSVFKKFKLVPENKNHEVFFFSIKFRILVSLGLSKYLADLGSVLVWKQ